ncbi:MAG: 30S ribosomal protein S3, partial [Desulfonatronovibrio sp.]
KLYHAGISRIEIERAADKVKLILLTSRPGIVIGRKGVEIEKLRTDLKNKFGYEFSLEVNEVRRPEVDAQLVAENIALQLERRVAFRRAMKRSISLALKFNAQGIKISCAGRLGGAEIARTEWQREGRVPLHTLRADIDYGFATAKTTYGIIGVKVWIYKGDILNEVK